MNAEDWQSALDGRKTLQDFLTQQSAMLLDHYPLFYIVLKLYTSVMLSEKQKHQLQVLKDIQEISQLCSTSTFIWGGLTRDILEGYFLREHHDIDCFTLNLLDVKNDISDLFKRNGYSTEYLSDFDMLIIDHNGCKATFNRLETEKEIAMWRHIGNEGTLYFPQAWLVKVPISFYGIPLLVSGAEFEYVIKSKVKLLSPEWKPRDKDLEALEYWSQKLKLRNINHEDLLKQVWSDNPYWRKKGYQEY